MAPPSRSLAHRCRLRQSRSDLSCAQPSAQQANLPSPAKKSMSEVRPILCFRSSFCIFQFCVSRWTIFFASPWPPVLVMQTFQRDGSVEEIIRQLTKRLEKQNWAVRFLPVASPSHSRPAHYSLFSYCPIYCGLFFFHPHTTIPFFVVLPTTHPSAGRVENSDDNPPLLS